MHYVYVLESVKLKELYIGQTNDLKRRLVKHREDMLKRFSAGYKELRKRIKNSVSLQVEGH